jgi:hypothetical protein
MPPLVLTESESGETETLPSRPVKRQKLISRNADDCTNRTILHVGAGEDIGPPSACDNWIPPTSPTLELHALKAIEELAQESGDLDPAIILEEFVIYAEMPKIPKIGGQKGVQSDSYLRLTSLHELEVIGKRYGRYLFDGYLKYNRGLSRYKRSVSIKPHLDSVNVMPKQRRLQEHLLSIRRA